MQITKKNWQNSGKHLTKPSHTSVKVSKTVSLRLFCCTGKQKHKSRRSSFTPSNCVCDNLHWYLPNYTIAWWEEYDWKQWNPNESQKQTQAQRLRNYPWGVSYMCWRWRFSCCCGTTFILVIIALYFQLVLTATQIVHYCSTGRG